MASINGLTSLSIHKNRSYSGSIFLHNTTKYKVITKIKEWFTEKKEIHKNITICIREHIEFYKNEPVDCLTIYGNIIDDLYNDHSIFDYLYNFFQFLMIECEQTSMIWKYDGFESNTVQKMKKK